MTTNNAISSSNLLYNSYRFNPTNSARREVSGQNNGQPTFDGRYGFDCSGFVNYLLNKGGYAVGAQLATSATVNSKGVLSPAGAQWQSKIDASAAKPGDLVYFQGHVGIVVSFNATTGKGVYRSSTTSKGIIDDVFDTAHGWYGKPFEAFTRVTVAYDRSEDTLGAGTDTSKYPPLAPLLAASSMPDNGTRWLDTMFTWESQSKGGYSAENGKALGRYQLQTNTALKELKYTNADGSWTGKEVSGVAMTSKEVFLKSTTAQDSIAREYADTLRNQLKSKGAWDKYVNQVVGGQLVTAEGLIGAAWERGAGGALKVLNQVDKGKIDFLTSDSPSVREFGKRLDQFRGALPPGQSGQSSAVKPDAALPAAIVPDSLRPDFMNDTHVTRHQDGSTTRDWIAKVDSPDGSIKKGDSVSVTYNQDGGFDARYVWHVDGSVESWERNGTAQEVYSRWDSTELVVQVTYAEGDMYKKPLPGTQVIFDGIKYNSDGTPVIDPQNPVTPSPIDPDELDLTTSPGDSVTEGDAAQTVESDLSDQQSDAGLTDTTFGLADVDLSQVLQGTQVGYVPGAEINSASAFEAEMVSQGYTVTRDENGIYASKGDKFFSFTDEAMTFYNGDEWAVVARRPNGEMVSGSHLGVNERELHVEIAGAETELRGHFIGTGDDLGDNESAAFAIDQVTTINGQVPMSSPLLNQSLGQLNLNLENLTYGYAIPGELASYVAYLDPQNPTGLPTAPTTDNKPWYQLDGAQKLGGVLTSMQSLIASLKSGKPLAIATDTFNLAMSASPNPDLKDTGQYLNYANSLVNFAGAFERGDDLSAFMSGASIVKQYMQSQASTALDALTHAIGTAAGTGAVTQLQNASTKWNDTTKLQEEFAKNPALTQNPDAQSKLANYVDAKDLFQKLDVGLNILSVHNAFSTGGNEVGKVQAVAFLLAAMDAQWALWAGPVGWAMAGISIIGSLFGSEPDIWGTAYAVNDANGATRAQILENHDDGGLHAVAALDDLIDQLEDNSVKDGLGLIAQRLPGVQVWYDGRPNVFTLWFEDAQTGVFTARGYDKDGKYLGELDAQSNLIAPDVNQANYFGNMGQHFATAADVASAVVPLWMQQTIDQQAALGLQYAGKSTELRAKEQGQLLATNPGNALPGNAGNLDDSSTQTARLITLDWDDNGSIAVATRAQGHGVLVDIDNDGSAEETDWIGTHDAILVLDHNGNGKVDNGHELFNDAQINTALRGLHALDEFDANGDGKITASDPVYNQLKVWLDIQHDGQMQAFETLSLAAANISELGINSGQFVRNGEADLMTTTALTADSAGTIVHVEGNNLRVLKETGDTLLMVSALADFAKSTDAQVRDSHTRLSANGSLTVVNELMDGVEDTAIVVSVEQLLKNDTSSAGTTSISMVGGAFGGTVSLDAAQGTIRFTPSAEFSGEGSFRYVVTDAQGQKVTGKALVNVAGVNDAPVLTNLGATKLIAACARRYCGRGRFDGEKCRQKSPTRLRLFPAACRAKSASAKVGTRGLGCRDLLHNCYKPCLHFQKALDS
jgi:hypothetical protein